MADLEDLDAAVDTPEGEVIPEDRPNINDISDDTLDERGEPAGARIDYGETVEEEDPPADGDTSVEEVPAHFDDLDKANQSYHHVRDHANRVANENAALKAQLEAFEAAQQQEPEYDEPEEDPYDPAHVAQTLATSPAEAFQYALEANQPTDARFVIAQVRADANRLFAAAAQARSDEDPRAQELDQYAVNATAMAETMSAELEDNLRFQQVQPLIERNMVNEMHYAAQEVRAANANDTDNYAKEIDALISSNPGYYLGDGSRDAMKNGISAAYHSVRNAKLAQSLHDTTGGTMDLKSYIDSQIAEGVKSQREKDRADRAAKYGFGDDTQRRAMHPGGLSLDAIDSDEAEAQAVKNSLSNGRSGVVSAQELMSW